MHPRQVEAELAQLLGELTGRPFPVTDPAAADGPLWSAGLTSADFIRLLTLLEDRFGFSWSLDDSAEALSSFRALVRHVSAHATTLPTGAGRGEER